MERFKQVDTDLMSLMSGDKDSIALTIAGSFITLLNLCQFSHKMGGDAVGVNVHLYTADKLMNLATALVAEAQKIPGGAEVVAKLQKEGDAQASTKPA